MQTGKVKWFDATKGYGFVEPSDKSKDVFLHIAELERAGIVDLLSGQHISFDTKVRNGKTSAIDIKLL